jgi:two-component system response regulator HydG
MGDVRGARRALEARRAGGRRLSILEAMLLRGIEAQCLAADGHEPMALVERFIRQTGAYGIRRWGWRRDAMHLLHGVATLFDLVQDADDEQAALRRGCSWVREHASADAAGIVAGDGTRVIAGEGVSPAELDGSDLRGSLGLPAGRTIVDGPHALITTPVRYGGATIGMALVRGRAESVDTLRGAAKALASVCAPALRARLDALAILAASRTLVPEMLGCSPAVANLREAAARAATTGFPVLVEGESGTGKELVARAIHRLSPRRDRRLAALNCAALTDELVEAELFGYVRGAFTGALQTRAGLFEESHGSTLFLDEVAELSPRAQAKLLRVLQEREIRRVGEHLSRPIDVRVVAATNVPLARAVGDARFREDLLFRLAVVRIRVPPLRERIEDVPLLALAFWRSVTEDTGKRTILGADAVAALCRYHWPGNVRELQNVIAALVVAAPTRGRVGARHVDQVLTGGPSSSGEAGGTLESAREALDRRMIMAALARHRGRCAPAARELGLSRQGLAKAMRRLGVAPSMSEASVDGNEVPRPIRARRAGLAAGEQAAPQ